MAYQKKYYWQFIKLKSTEVHIVELWQDTVDVLVAEEIIGMTNSFSVEMPELDHKFQVVRGTGCQINILSETDMKFFDGLYHVDPTEFKVKHYIDGSLNWIGYLNSEMFAEPYDIDFNYAVSTNGNDGFALMDRFSFIQSDETNYIGVKSKFEILKIIFDKIGLDWTEWRIALSTTFTGYSAAINSTILHESYINCANFYDEDDKPMSLRSVIESILAPYGAFVRTIGDKIYVIDIHTLSSLTSVTYKQFNYDGTYTGFIAVPNRKAISDIGYMGTGQSIEKSGGVNRQVVAYSPYPIKSILDESLINVDEFITVPVSYSTKDGYFYKTLLTNIYWEIPIPRLATSSFEISYFTDEEDSNIYMRYPRYGGVNGAVMTLIDGIYVNASGATPNSLSSDPSRPLRRRTKYYDGVAFLITGDVLVKTKDNPYDESQISKGITNIQQSYLIKVGNKYFDQSINGWTETLTVNYLITNDSQNAVIADRFVPIGKNGLGQLIIIGNIAEEITLDGDLEFELWAEYKSSKNDDITLVTNSTDVQEIWTKNISIQLVNYDGTDIEDNDIEYIGLLDKTFQNEGEKITLTCGTDTQFADRGKILKSDGTNYTDILSWTRAAQSFKIEELLLGSLSSNYRSGYLMLNNMKLKNLFSFQNIITDTFIAGKLLMIRSANVNYHDDTVDCSFIEITADELIIVK